MAHLNVLVCSLFFILKSPNYISGDSFFHPGEIWKDTDGKFINAHGGGILYHEDTYYWYGEIKEGETHTHNGRMDHIDASGVSCYSSKDLYHWKNEGVVLSPEVNDTTSDIHPNKIIERPKVIYNEKTKQFVMWLYIDTEDYASARAGVADCVIEWKEKWQIW